MNRSEEQTKRPPSMQCHCDSLHTGTVITPGVCVLSGGSSKDEVPHCFLFQGAGADGQLSQVCSCGAHLPAYTKVPTLQHVHAAQLIHACIHAQLSVFR